MRTADSTQSARRWRRERGGLSGLQLSVSSAGTLCALCVESGVPISSDSI